MSFRSTIVPLLLMGLLAGCDRQVSTQEQAKAAKLPVENTGTPPGPEAPRAGDANTGEPVIVDNIGTLDRSHKGEAAQAASFQDPTGRLTTMASFAGKPVLLNLWATWCGPCVNEMPTLDAAAERMTIAAVSQDLGPEAPAKVKAFLTTKGLSRIQPYVDPKANLSVAYNAELPTSILYDSTGHEVWRMTGGMNWTTDTAKALLAEAH